MKGLDISKWQKGISLGAIKEAGYGFVILRGGYTRYGDRTLVKDECFEKFYTQAKKNGLGVGVYWYSCANNRKTGKAEAEYLYKNCLKNKQFEYPIYIDTENPKWQRDNPKGTTEAVLAFCEYLEARGFYVGIYASLSWFYDNLELNKVEDYSKWVACWGKKKPEPKFTGFDMWQHTDSAKVNGKKVDANICYVDFPTAIKALGKNGYKSATALAKEVIDGKWGNGSERKRRLTKAGYDYQTVQNIVNRLLAH